MADAFDIEPLVPSKPVIPVRRKNPDNREQQGNKNKSNAKKTDQDSEEKDKSSNDDDQDLLHIDEFA